MNSGVLNSVSVKKRKFPHLRTLLYLPACDIFWNFIRITHSRNNWRGSFPCIWSLYWVLLYITSVPVLKILHWNFVRISFCCSTGLLQHPSTLMQDNHFVLHFLYPISRSTPSISSPSPPSIKLKQLLQRRSTVSLSISYLLLLPSFSPCSFPVPLLWSSCRHFPPLSTNGGRLLGFPRKS